MPMEKRLRTIKPTPLRGKLTDEEIEWGWEQVSKENERLKLEQEGKLPAGGVAAVADRKE